jgi:hypothetical protein
MVNVKCLKNVRVCHMVLGKQAKHCRRAFVLHVVFVYFVHKQQTLSNSVYNFFPGDCNSTPSKGKVN